MITVLLFIAVVIAAVGLVLIADYLLGRFTGELLDLEVTGFQEKKSLGRALPIVARVNAEDQSQEIKITTIDQIGYLISPAIAQQVIRVAVMKTGQARVYGYLRLSAGVLMILPLLAALALKFGRAAMMGQVLYIGLFCAIAVGGWIVLRLIAR